MPRSPGSAVPALGALLTLTAVTLTGCASSAGAKTSAVDAAAVALPSTVPGGTTLRVADQNLLLQTLLSASGQDSNLPYDISWSAFQGGPAILEAFRAKAVDVGFVADAPVLVARAAGQKVRIVGAVQGSTSSTHLWTSPTSKARTLADLKGAKVAVTEGTTLQVAVLQALKNAGLKSSDVTLAKLSPVDTPPALGANQVDVGALTEPLVSKYDAAYSGKGAHELDDDKNLTSGLQFLIAPDAVTADPARSAAVADLSARFTRAELWLTAHKDVWVQKYYVETQKLPKAIGDAVVADSGTATIPTYAAATAALQKVADLLADYQALPAKVDAAAAFDQRFDAVQQAAAKSAG
ncbi:MetQ/NlpA family ABC transporter substrate-binding protein [Kitasatospora sp. NBC_00240]|uniref:ABC transporter substrate-binding protein n=1 Tax=Kitasatospora sp. NBC_00240 TaxID=2903567 RepID=UPI00224DF45B|nr:ABC transporter substrate-binding protein [Kitasatospora sp. NBC_00240]MCX5208451.1 MetQ/NlpA family ABC transporter substrate-binding protein [Kitasatospora sp. NBC_00240]MCX5213332.1 MetQ/NlpA family ABC transporter substrate-binding protein [Kitasatospora sp. NBC_00240]